jgi:hypothetical protein
VTGIGPRGIEFSSVRMPRLVAPWEVFVPGGYMGADEAGGERHDVRLRPADSINYKRDFGGRSAAGSRQSSANQPRRGWTYQPRAKPWVRMAIIFQALKGRDIPTEAVPEGLNPIGTAHRTRFRTGGEIRAAPLGKTSSGGAPVDCRCSGARRPTGTARERMHRNQLAMRIPGTADLCL